MHKTRAAYLDSVDHLLRLILPALISHTLQLILQQPKLVFISPIRILNKCLLGTIEERRFPLLACDVHDLGKVVPLTAQTFQHLLLERAQRQLVQVLDLSEEEWGKGGVEYCDEICAFALVHALVIPRRIRVVSS